MDEEIRNLEAEVAERQAKIAQLSARAAHEAAADLEAFERLSDADQAQVYRSAPDHYAALMQRKCQRAEQALMERQPSRRAEVTP